MAEPYTPTEAEIVNGSYHLGDYFWRELTEAEVTRGIAAIKAETLRAERARIAAAIEAARPEVGPHINVSVYRQARYDGMTTAARIALGEQP